MDTQIVVLNPNLFAELKRLDQAKLDARNAVVAAQDAVKAADGAFDGGYRVAIALEGWEIAGSQISLDLAAGTMTRTTLGAEATEPIPLAATEPAAATAPSDGPPASDGEPAVAPAAADPLDPTARAQVTEGDPLSFAGPEG